MKAVALREKILERLPDLKSKGQCRVPNQRFWDFYNARKDELHAACIGVRKNDKNGDWMVVAYPYEDVTEKYTREIEGMKARLILFCPQCGSPPHKILETRQRNNSISFYLRCCDVNLSTPLKHKLVDHLVKEEGYELTRR